MAELQREEITARIKQARMESGLTQPEMADLLDVSMRTYQNYEATRVPWSQINAIASATGKTPEWLLHGDPPPSPDLMAVFGDGDRLDRIESKLDELLTRLPPGRAAAGGQPPTGRDASLRAPTTSRPQRRCLPRRHPRLDP